METKEIVDGLKSVGDKIETSKAETAKQLADFKAANDVKISEIEKAHKDELQKKEDQVKQLNEDLGKQGKTLKEITEVVEAMKKDGGKLNMGGAAAGKNAKDVINDIFTENKDAIAAFRPGQALSFEAKAGNITIGNVTNLSGSFVNVPMQYSDQIYTRPTRKVQIRDLVPVINITANSFIYYRQPVTGAIGAGSFGFQAGQGNTKAQLDYNLQPVVVTPDYLAGTARISKQMLNDLPSMQTFLSGQLIEDYRRSESNNFVPTLVASATAFAATGTVTAEKIVQATGDLFSRDWDPSGIVVDQSGWVKLMNTRPNDYGLPGGGLSYAIDSNGNARFLGMPIVIQNNMPVGQVIVGDFTKAAIVQAEGLSVGFYDQDQDNVIKNLITARVEARVAFTVMRPDAFDFFGIGLT